MEIYTAVRRFQLHRSRHDILQNDCFTVYLNIGDVTSAHYESTIQEYQKGLGYYNKRALKCMKQIGNFQ